MRVNTKGSDCKNAAAEIIAWIVIKPWDPVVQVGKAVILAVFGYTQDDKSIDVNPA